MHDGKKNKGGIAIVITMGKKPVTKKKKKKVIKKKKA
jgi:hypothetical protein|tara:strand:- start:369 stop:479 length:111 start_codon:yes stop_codon:yes gene_type:complete